MASTAAAYRNSDGSTSGKRGNFFSRDTLETLFENCDLRPHHVNMIAAMWRAAGKPHGQEILLFAAVEGYRIEARYRSRRAVQYNLRALEALGVIELAKAANTIRRPATYRLRTDQLGKRQTYADIKNARKSPPSVSHSSPPPAQEPAAPPSTPHTAAPVPVAPSTINEYWGGGKRNSHRSALGSRAQQRVHELRQELVARMVALMRGDGKNRAPMSQENAFTSCCMYFGISADEAAEQLKLVCFKPPAPLQPDFPREPQKQIPPHEGSAWEKILVLLESRVNRHSFETWLRPTRFAGEQSGVLYVRIPTSEFRHVAEKYAALISEAIAELGMEFRDVKFEEASGP